MSILCIVVLLLQKHILMNISASTPMTKIY
ncbi:MAG: hypothetical protein HDT23_03735 [Ruminococcus sp.]|nr:hypothetical protein [Ruminococcus sp.]